MFAVQLIKCKRRVCINHQRYQPLLLYTLRTMKCSQINIIIIIIIVFLSTPQCSSYGKQRKPHMFGTHVRERRVCVHNTNVGACVNGQP